MVYPADLEDSLAAGFKPQGAPAWRVQQRHLRAHAYVFAWGTEFTSTGCLAPSLTTEEN